MTTLLRQIQEGATDHATPTAELLRKAIILAKRLDYPPLGEWAQRELEGYPSGADLPDYRAYRRCQVKGNFNGMGGSSMRNQPLPSASVSEDHRQRLFGYELREGVPKYESLAEGDGDLSMPWDMNYVVHYQSDFYELFALSNAWRVLGRGDLTQLLEGVRTRLLNFSLDIESTNPDAGEAQIGEPPMPAETVNAAFHLNVWGDNNVVTTAGRDLAQVTIDAIEWEKLREALVDLGVPDDRLEDLRGALEEDAVQRLPKGAMGPATAAWYEGLTAAIGNGALTLSTEVAGGMIAAELLKFLGAG